jgi:hypothetical protein
VFADWWVVELAQFSGQAASVPSPQGIVCVSNSQKTNELSPDSVCKVPKPTTMKLTPLNHWFSTTINYHQRKYTYQNLHTPNTRKVSDTRRRSHHLTKKLHEIHSASQIDHITSKWTLLWGHQLTP